MVGTSKILTVSYGTFSCTLEGFDDSFSTMKAIAEYFRDLAADDRYFGAEPPTPDAEMLARIASRESTRHVEARTDGTDIVLRASPSVAKLEARVAEAAASDDSSVSAPVSETALSPDADPTPEIVPEIPKVATQEVPASSPEVDVAQAAPGSETEAHASALLAVSEPVELSEASPERAVVAPAYDLPAAKAPTADASDIFLAGDADAAVDLPRAPLQRPAPRQVVVQHVATPKAESPAELVAEPVADRVETPKDVAAPAAAVASNPSIPAHPDADSVAAKLQRIRAVVGKQASGQSAIRTPDSTSAEDTLEESGADVADMSSLDQAPTMPPIANRAAIAALTRGLSAAEAEEAPEATDDTTPPSVPLTGSDAEQPALDAAAQNVAAETKPTAPVRARVIKMRRADFDRAVERGQLETETSVEAEKPGAVSDPLALSQSGDAQTNIAEPDVSGDITSPKTDADATAPITPEDTSSAPTDDQPAPSALIKDAMLQSSLLTGDDDDVSAYDASEEVQTKADLGIDLSADLSDGASYDQAYDLLKDQQDTDASAFDDDSVSQEDLADLEALDGSLSEGATDTVSDLSAEDEADLMAELASVEREMGLQQDHESAIQPEEEAENYDAAGADEADDDYDDDTTALETLSSELSVQTDLAETTQAEADAESATEDALDGATTQYVDQSTEQAAEDGGEHADVLAPTEDAAKLDTDADTEDASEAKPEDDASAAATGPRRVRRVQMLHAPADDEAAVSRIMSKADAQLDEPEANRRRQAIAQLKAAVAAKEADRSLGTDQKDEGEVENAFRKDLRDVVRPSRPQAATARTERPRAAPLKLVAAQRVDMPTAAPSSAAPVRPRRVAVEETSPSTVSQTAGAVEAAAKAGSFADFADDMGAHSLGDLLEAAAAYTSFVEGSEDFSRPQLINKVRETSDEFSREDGLRSFGTLLREGRITKVRNGRFQVSGETRFHPERRAG